MRDGDIKEVTIQDSKGKIKLLGEIDQTQFDVIDDSNIVISSRKKKKYEDVYRIYQISIQFSSWDINLIYEEKEIINKIVNYGFDEKDKCIILLKKDKLKEKISKKYYLTIVELQDDDQYLTLYNNRILNEKLIGRIKSGFFMVVNGYIYFNNEVIKIRYDLLKEENSTVEYQEKVVFDYYEDVLKFEKPAQGKH